MATMGKSKQISGQINMFDYLQEIKAAVCSHSGQTCYGSEGPVKEPEHVPPIHSYLRYGPHTLVPEVREETKAWLDRNGVPEWVKWGKDSYPCKNCTWYDGIACRRGFLKTHREYGYLICDNFYQSIVERKPSTVGDSYPKLIEKVYPVDIKDICDDAFCPVCGDGIDELKWMDCDRCPSCWARISWEPWHRANDKENEEIWGPDWRDKFGKMLKKTKEEE